MRAPSTISPFYSCHSPVLSLPTSSPLILSSFFSSFVSLSTGASSVSGEPVVEGRAGWCSAATAGKGTGGCHTGGTQQTPAVHVHHTEIRLRGAAAGETNCSETECVYRCTLSANQVLKWLRVKLRLTSWQLIQHRADVCLYSKTPH